MHVHDNIPYYLTMSSILLNNNNILVTTYLSTKYPYLSLRSILMCFCRGEHPLECGKVLGGYEKSTGSFEGIIRKKFKNLSNPKEKNRIDVFCIFNYFLTL